MWVRLTTGKVQLDKVDEFRTIYYEDIVPRVTAEVKGLKYVHLLRYNIFANKLCCQEKIMRVGRISSVIAFNFNGVFHAGKRSAIINTPSNGGGAPSIKNQPLCVKAPARTQFGRCSRRASVRITR